MLVVRWVRRVQVNTWALLFVCALWLAINARWLVEYRRKQLMDIDEAGYVGMALNDHYSAVRDGLTGWLKTIEYPGIQAPVTPALTSLQFFLTGPYVLTAFAVPLLAGLSIILMTYGLANRLGGRRLAWPAMILIATAPGVIVESRAYHFGAPAAAVTLAAVCFLVRSDGMSKLGSSIGFGVFVGLMPLTRTMTIAFVPALVLAAVLQAAVGSERRRRLVNFGVAVVVAVAVAALWLVPNGLLVYRYLTGFGYGPEAAEYGTESGILNPAAWLYRLHLLLLEQFLPHVTLLLVGLCVALFVAIRRMRSTKFAEFTRLAVTSPILPLVALVVEGLLAFATSKTTGNGFTLPLVPAMVLVGVWGLYRVHPYVRRALPVLVAVIGLVAFVPFVDLRAPTAKLWTVELPLVNRVTVTDGRGTAETFEALGLDPDETEPISADVALQWIASTDWAAQQIIDRKAIQGLTAFGFRDRLFNVNTVEDAFIQKKHYGVAVTQIKPTEAGNTVADYGRWLTTYQDSLSGEASHACLLFTATGTQNEFLPVVDPPAMAQAAMASGFTAVDSHPLPNGRMLTLWHRPEATC